ADQIEGRDTLGNPGRVGRGQLHDAMRQADLFGALARRGEKHFGCRRVRILLEKVVLDLPGEVVAKPVGELDLVERVLVELELALRRPRARQLQFVEYAELHTIPSSDGNNRPSRWRLFSRMHAPAFSTSARRLVGVKSCK